MVYGGPFISGFPTNKLKIAGMLLSALEELCRKDSVFIQFRTSYVLSEYDDVFNHYAYRWHPRLNRLVNTEDKTKVMGRMLASRRRQVRKSPAGGSHY